MKGNYRPYEHVASASRIDSILALPQGNYEEVGTLPNRESLTFKNGYYANKCVAVFVDIRDSSSLPAIYRRPALAKLYRAYISEAVAILNGCPSVVEVNIVGDGVWAVYNSPLKSDVEHIFAAIARINSLMKVLNYKLLKAGYETPVAAGIGASFGRALMIKAGLDGSGINDVVYMGDVVNHAAKLAARGNSGWGAAPIYLANDFVGNLDNEQSKSFCQKDWSSDAYTANVLNSEMNDWYLANCS